MTTSFERKQWAQTALRRLEARGVTVTKLPHCLRLTSPFGHVIVSDASELSPGDVRDLTHPAPIVPEDRSSATDARMAMRSYSNRR